MGHLAANSRAFFITGTDTEVGKTFFSLALIEALNNRNLKTAAYKPVAAGCEDTPDGLRNADALALQNACTIELDYSEVNPIALAEAVAPHLAAQHAINKGQVIDMSLTNIQQGFSRIFKKQADVIIVEGAGGWRLPLGSDSAGKHIFLSDFVANMNLSVILVVGVRLGCLNHAALTADNIRQRGLKLAGWVANKIDPDMPFLQENIDSLNALLGAPMVAELPHLASYKDAAKLVDLDCLGFQTAQKRD